MATLTITRTISAGDLTRVIAALKSHYGMPNATNAQLQKEWEVRTFAALKGLVKDHERGEAAKSATNGVSEITLTE